MAVQNGRYESARGPLSTGIPATALTLRISAASVFFFQAEDGIRDFCLSRGLGDVYKRQDYWGI